MKIFKTLIRITTGTILALFLTTNASATEAANTNNTLKVLSVGNSFSANAHKFLPQIAKSMGKELVLRNAFIGGCSLEKHARHMKEYEQDPKKGNVYHGGSLIKLLQLEDWDIVTIQQVSHESFKPGSYEPYASEIIERIKKYAPNAEIVVHQTWGYNKNNGRLKGWGMTPEEMAAQVIDTYQKFAAGKSFRYIPAGVVIVDGKGAIRECNRLFAELAGALEEFEALGNLEGLYVDSFLPEFSDLFRSALSHGSEIVKYRQSWRGRIVNVSVFPITRGGFAGAVVQDVTLNEGRREEIAAKAKAVIRKNVYTVQQVARLFGEHIAETEVMLNEIAGAYESHTEGRALRSTGSMDYLNG